jgi:hypothetical protein
MARDQVPKLTRGTRDRSRPEDGALSWRQLFVSPIQGRESDERFTPRWVFDGIAETFDLDPASPVGGGDCVPAHRKLTRREDGLAQTWEGFVWLNPPFGTASPWADRFREHGNGIWLGPVANSRAWLSLAATADVLWHCRDFEFHHPAHAGKRSSMPLAVIGLGVRAVDGVRRLAGSGRHDGVLFVRPSESEDSDG